MSKLDGYKTYIVAGALGLLAAGRYLGYIDQTMGDFLQGLLLGGGLAALKSAVKKVE